MPIHLLSSKWKLSWVSTWALPNLAHMCRVFNCFLNRLNLHTCISRVYCNLVWFRVWSLLSLWLYHYITFPSNDYFILHAQEPDFLSFMFTAFLEILEYLLRSTVLANVSWALYHLKWPLSMSVQYAYSSKDTTFGDEGGVPCLAHFPLNSRLLPLKSKCSLPMWNGCISSLRQTTVRRRNDAVFFSSLSEAQFRICCKTT